MNILFINNYDSIVYNLVNYVCQLSPNANIIIEDNNITIEKVKEYSIDKIIISPGPGHPNKDQPLQALPDVPPVPIWRGDHGPQIFR